MKSLLLKSAILLALCVSTFAADLSITAGSVVPGANARYHDGIAGATLTQGQIVYADPADSGKLKLADANTAAHFAANVTVIGIMINAGSAGQQVRCIIWDDDLTIGDTVSMSAPIYVVSATAGGIAPSADIAATMYPVVLCIAKSTTKVIFDPLRQGVAAAVAP